MSIQPVPVSIYIDENCWAGSALLIKELLAVAGTLHARSADVRGAELFHVTLVGPTRDPVKSFTGSIIVPEQSVRGASGAQVIVIPPFFFPDEQKVPIPPAFKRWLMRAREDGAFLVGLTSGVRLLAESGLLDGHEVTGNLSDQKAFAKNYPQIHFTPQTPLVIDGRIISAASVNPSIDACSYLVSHFFGEKTALKFARYTNSVSQPTYEQMALSTAPWKQHADQRVKQAQAFIERYFKQDISVEDAARRAAMSARNFTRRFQLAVGMPPVRYIARCRVEHAKKLISQPGTSMLQVAMACGFNDEASFRRAFKRIAGVTPTQYRTSSATKGNSLRE